MYSAYCGTHVQQGEKCDTVTIGDRDDLKLLRFVRKDQVLHILCRNDGGVRRQQKLRLTQLCCLLLLSTDIIVVELDDLAGPSEELSTLFQVHAIFTHRAHDALQPILSFISILKTIAHDLLPSKECCTGSLRALSPVQLAQQSCRQAICDHY